MDRSRTLIPPASKQRNCNDGGYGGHGGGVGGRGGVESSERSQSSRESEFIPPPEAFLRHGSSSSDQSRKSLFFLPSQRLTS